jgi:hypothetical protein
VSTVNERAQVIFDYLSTHLGQGFTLEQLLAATGLENGTKTANAIRRARDIATANGLHFPPAIKVRGGVPLYRVTDQAADAVRPTQRMHAIARGVRRREEVGLDFMTAHQEQLDPAAQAELVLVQQTRTAIAAIQAVEDAHMARLAATMDGQPAA